VQAVARLMRAGQGRAGRAGQRARGLLIRAEQARALLIRPCRAGQGRAGQGRAGQGRAGQGRAGQGRAGQGRAGQGRACTARQGAMSDLSLLLSLQLVTVHLLLQVALGVLIDLDQINLLVGRVLGLSLELVQQITLTDEVVCLLALAINSTLQAVNLALQVRHFTPANHH